MTVGERFWAKVDASAGLGACWEWLAYRGRDGYGQFGVGRVVKRAHRVAFELARGPVPDGLTLDHLCRNRGCVNPVHLEPVTAGENVLRGISPAATHARAEQCPQGHQYDAGNTYTYRGWRRCRRCNADRARRRRVNFKREG